MKQEFIKLILANAVISGYYLKLMIKWWEVAAFFVIIAIVVLTIRKKR